MTTRTVTHEPRTTTAEVNDWFWSADENGVEVQAAVSVLPANVAEQSLVVCSSLAHEALRISISARTRASASKASPRIIQEEYPLSVNYEISDSNI